MISWCLQASAGHSRYCHWTTSKWLLLHIMNKNLAKKPDGWIVSIFQVTRCSDDDDELNLTIASLYFLFPNEKTWTFLFANDIRKS